MAPKVQHYLVYHTLYNGGVTLIHTQSYEFFISFYNMFRHHLFHSCNLLPTPGQLTSTLHTRIYPKQKTNIPNLSISLFPQISFKVESKYKKDKTSILSIPKRGL